MSHKNSADQILFGGVASYRITVQGSVPEAWSDRLAGMKVAVGESESTMANQSILEGELCDQSELNGVLDTLYHLHLPIIKVEHMASKCD